ncbi:MAG TPA: hypothetical protein EYO33_19920 [Phycisphaerales bacterium]|nr:hypothetical protein [Phycisphaerales bacterium]
MSLENAILVLAEAVQELAAAIGGEEVVTIYPQSPDTAQTSIEDFTLAEQLAQDFPNGVPGRSMAFTYYDKHRKGITRCGRCGKVGYNIRSCDRHQDL